MVDKIFGFFTDSSDSASMRYWIARTTDLAFEELAPLAKDFEDIYGAVPDLAGSPFELSTTLKAYFRELIYLQKNGSVSIRLDPKNIAAGYAFFLGSERNLLNYGAYQYHASPSRLAHRYEIALQRYVGEENKEIYAALDHTRGELSHGIFDGEEGERELYLYHYLIYALEEADPRMSAIARFILERLGRIVTDEGADENRTEHIYFFEKVVDALPDLEDLRDDMRQRTAGHTPEVKMLLLAFNGEYNLFEAFIRFFNALSDKGYFETFKDFVEMPKVAGLLEEVTDQAIYSRLSDKDRWLIANGLKMMRVGMVEDDRSELDDDIKHRLNTAAEVMLDAIKKDWSSGSAPQTPEIPVQPGGGSIAGRGPLMYHAPWMGMVPAMQAGATVFTAARPMPLLGMPLAMPVTPF